MRGVPRASIESVTQMKYIYLFGGWKGDTMHAYFGLSSHRKKEEEDDDGVTGRWCLFGLSDQLKDVFTPHQVRRLRWEEQTRSTQSRSLEKYTLIMQMCPSPLTKSRSGSLKTKQEDEVDCYDITYWLRSLKTPTSSWAPNASNEHMIRVNVGFIAMIDYQCILTFSRRLTTDCDTTSNTEE